MTKTLNYWINHLHFFDPMHSIRRKLWTSTYLSLESYLPTSKRCWWNEFVEMKIWNLQSLLVSPINLWRVSSTEDDRIFGWRSWLASLILNWFLFLTLFHCRWVNRFFSSGTPWIGLLRIRCWRGRNWICKKTSPDIPCVSQMLGGPSLRLGIPIERLSIPPGIGWGGKDTGRLVTCESPLRTDSASWNLHSCNKFLFAIPVSHR